MTDEQWEGWEEWLQHPLTLAFREALASRAKALKQEFTEGLWHDPEPDRDQAYYVDLRARALVCEEFSELDRDSLSNLIPEHTR